MAGIRFDRITKAFDEVVAVDDVSLEVDDSEFLVLLGPSGCGKSTLLRMLAGLEVPTSGDVAIGDEIVTDVDPRHRDVAMVFQSYALYPHMTVAKNIESPLIGRSRELPKERRATMVREVAAMLELDELLGRKPGQLSGGQRQRVALARAIVRDPAVFLMDEPLSNLDAKLRARTRSEIVDLHERLETTFVYVTHDQVEAMTMASQIAILDQGALQQIGDPRSVYGRPANVFVARFIGSPPMNVVPGRVHVGDDGAAVEIGGGRLELYDRWLGLVDGSEVQVGVRPEHLTFSDRGIPASVGATEWLGHEQILHLDVADHSLLLRHDGEDVVPRPGATGHVTVEAGHVHLFDAATGDRLADRR